METPRSLTPTGREGRSRRLREDVLRRSRSVSPPDDRDSFLDESAAKEDADESGKGEGIRVVARFRPSNTQELNDGGVEMAEYSEDFRTVRIKVPERIQERKEKVVEPKMKDYEFSYDQVFPPDATQDEIYRSAAEPIVSAIMSGVNGAVVAYGQTGAGKTYTMQGPGFDDPRAFERGLDETTRGVIPRLMEDLFMRLSHDVTYEYEVVASYVEIYNEKLRDLLHDPRERQPRLSLMMTADRGLFMPDVIQTPIASIRDVMRLMKVGAINRHVGSTNSNEESSRSHAIFLVSVKKRDPVERITKMAQLYLVDLAGSERLSKTGAQGQRFLEMQNINKSLFAFGQMISALSKGERVRYRDSLLTRMLQNSFGGNSKTCLIISCSPNTANAEETLSTLRFGDKTKAIFNKPKVNQERSAAELLYLLEKSRKEVESQRSYIHLLENELRQMRQSTRSRLMPAMPSEKLEIVDLDAAVDGPSSPTLLPPPSAPAAAFASPPATPRTTGAALVPHAASSSSTGVMPARPALPHPALSSARGAALLEVDCLSFLCPISRNVMRDPVFAMDGHTYDRTEIERYLQANDNRSPITNVRLGTQRTIQNYSMKRQLRVLGPALQRLFDDHSALLPDELLLQVFSFLDAASLCRASQVCYNWWVCSQDPTVWSGLLDKDFSNYNQELLMKTTEKQLYRRLHEAAKKGHESSSMWRIRPDPEHIIRTHSGLTLVSNA